MAIGLALRERRHLLAVRVGLRVERRGDHRDALRIERRWACIGRRVFGLGVGQAGIIANALARMIRLLRAEERGWDVAVDAAPDAHMRPAAGVTLADRGHIGPTEQLGDQQRLIRRRSIDRRARRLRVEQRWAGGMSAWRGGEHSRQAERQAQASLTQESGLSDCWGSLTHHVPHPRPLTLHLTYYSACAYPSAHGKFGQLLREHSRNAISLHGDAIDRIGVCHRHVVVRDDDELCLLRERLEDLAEAHDIRLIQRGVHLIEQAERRRIRLQQREEQRRRDQRALAAGEQRQVLHLLARNLHVDLDAAEAGAPWQSGRGRLALVIFAASRRARSTPGAPTRQRRAT